MRRPPPPPGPCGVYLHFPFCAARCSYCDFPTVIGRDEAIEDYLDALVDEIRRSRVDLPGGVDSVFLGGGTPSRMTPSQVARLLAAVAQRFPVAAAAEVTLESNPESLATERLDEYRDAGVTRISIGVQSLDDAVLRGVGRMHDAAQALSVVEAAVATPQLEVNVDLILGLPGEALVRWGEGLERLAALGSDHLSLYLLETDKETPLARAVRRGQTALADDDRLARSYEASVEILARHSLLLYEISNFAREGRASRHNLKYWTDAWYAGFGLGAHGYADGERRANHAGLPAYMRAAAERRDPLEWKEAWDAERRLEEAAMLGLRLAAGLDVAELGRRYAVDVGGRFDAAWADGLEAGLLERRGDLLRLTPRGRLLSNEVFGCMLGD